MSFLKRIACKIRELLTVAIIVLTGCKILLSPAYSQNVLVNDSTVRTGSTRVQWIGQIPDNKEREQQKISETIKRILFGYKEPAPGKPVSVLAESMEYLLVLDQGLRSMMRIEKNKTSIINAFTENKYDFSSMIGMCSIPGKRILFTDSKENKIFVYSETQDKIEVFNDSLMLNQPTGIAYSKLRDEIWVVETKAHSISILNKSGEKVKTIGKRGTLEGEFNYPTSVWIDSTGKAYVVDAMNFRIQIFSEKGKLLSVFGEAGDATGYFARPKGIATDSHGHIYITDALFHVVQIFDSSGNFLYHFGSQGTKKEQFWMPMDIFIDNNNYIYVADSYNSRIQIFRLIYEEPDKEKN